MCEQTRISYLDGDIVWVKLGSYWWPGQVVGFDKLPEEIQLEYQKKQLIAVVKFFQEDSFEYVRNYQQVYKYNCTQKEDFIKKGLDKFRAKSKDGSNYMDKFPQDVKTAEVLTYGDPDILLSEKFSREEKPDISGLFGEKKVQKKKRMHDDLNKKNDSDVRRRITHRRFLQENDHEVRIRQQPTSNLPLASTGTCPGGIYPCHVCGFTTTRVNVIICHLKSHRLNNDTATSIKSKVKLNFQSTSKKTNIDSLKRKYVRKSISYKSKDENNTESKKRKNSKPVDKPSKKKKTDPELREKLLADWNVESDDDELSRFEKAVDQNSTDMSNKNQSDSKTAEGTDILNDKLSEDNVDNIDLIQESDKLLQETCSFAKLSSMLKDVPSTIEKLDSDESNMEKSDTLLSPTKSRDSYHFKKITVENSISKEKDDKKSRLACFDFDEDDVPETGISVRKIARGIGNKNISIKKEIIKEFEMSQALKHDTKDGAKNYDKNNISTETISSEENIEWGNKSNKNKANNIEKKGNIHQNNENLDKSIEICETQVEILEIFEVEKEIEKKGITKDEPEKNKDIRKFKGIVKPCIENVHIKKNIESQDIVKESLHSGIVESQQLEDFSKEILENFEEKKILGQLQSQNLQEKMGFSENNKEEITYPEENVTILSNFTRHISNTVNNPSMEMKQICLSEDQEIDSNKSLVKKEEKTILLLSSTSEIQKDAFFDTSEILPEDNEKTILTEDNSNFSIKKQHGRPKTSLVNTEEVASNNVDPKYSDCYTKIDVESDKKIMKSDSDYLYSDKKSRANLSYQSLLYLQSFEHKPSKTDESLSESDNRSEQIEIKSKIKRTDKDNIQSVETIGDSQLSSNDTDARINIEASIVKNSDEDNMEDKEFLSRDNYTLHIKETSEQSNYNDSKKQEIINAKDKILITQQVTDMELLPPKKSQIKKFEQSQIDIETNTANKLNKNSCKIIDDSKAKLNENLIDIHSETLSKEHQVTQVIHTLNKQNDELKLENFQEKSMFTEDKSLKIKIEMQTDDKHDYDKQVPVEMKNFCDNRYGFLLDTFVKTSEVENVSNVKANKCNKEEEKLNVKSIDLNNLKNVFLSDSSTSQSLTQEPIINNFSLIENFDSIEVIVTVNSDNNTNDNNVISVSNSGINAENSNLLKIENSVAKLDENSKKLDGFTNLSLSLPQVSDFKIVPVKKREKPRIIENVALKEPMILKTKLTEKHSGKIGKHKLESDNSKLYEPKGLLKSKVMKIEAVIPSNKSKSPRMSSNQNAVIKKKIIKALEADDHDSVTSPIADMKDEQISSFSTPIMSEVTCTEKYIQHNSQSLVDMELDINSMPFVLSEDVLTPESIEQMPVVISSIIPATNTITNLSSTLPATIITTKQIIDENQLFESSKVINEINSKTKSGPPTILKNKGKAKPTITSIKTIVPPLSSVAYKGGYKVNTHALKTSLGNPKSSGKYVIVQTSGHQQAHSTHQKVVIPTSKSSGNAQIVQQGSKVVILTSPQSGQSGQKIFPLNSISKALNTGKGQRIISTKQGQQIYTSANTQSLIGSKTILTSKNDLSSYATTSKMTGQKIMSQQQIITSKGNLSQVPGSSIKSTVLGTLPQGILTKEGIFTPINAATLGGKTIIGSKTLVSKAFSTQNINTSKNLLTPITQSLGSKTIISSQGIVSKGTVLTPITGSQVKALAAKNIKGNKLQCETIQRKIQFGNHKNPKVSISPLPARTGTLNLKAPNNVVVVQNTEFKTIMPSKKGIKPNIQKQLSVSTILSPTSITNVQQKINTVPVPNLEQKVINPKNVNQLNQVQENVITEKNEDNINIKPLINNEFPKVKITEEPKTTGITALTKTKSINRTLQKRIAIPSNCASLSSSNASALFSITVPPPIESVNYEKIPKNEVLEQDSSKPEILISSCQSNSVNAIEKMEEPKISAQAQIMALPTENSDGTHSYVLISVDEQGHIIPLDNNALMSLDDAPNYDGSRTLYIDSSSLTDSGKTDNIILQIENSPLSNLQITSTSEQTQILLPSKVKQNNNQDILAAALANTDFQHEIGVVETSSSPMTRLNQTSLINQTILQSTIIPPTEPISSPLVLETSLTLNQPIMTPLEVPSRLPIQSNLAPIVCTTVSASIQSPDTITSNENTSYITVDKKSVREESNSMTCIKETMKVLSKEKTTNEKVLSDVQSLVQTNVSDCLKSELVDCVSYSISIPQNTFNEKQIQATPSMPLIDDSFNEDNGFNSSNTSVVQDNSRSMVTKTSEELIKDLTGNDSLQENEILYQETVSQNKSFLSEPVASENVQIILSQKEDGCVSSQHSIAPAIEQSKDNVTSNNIQSLNEINKEILDEIKNDEEVSTALFNPSVDVKCSCEIETYGVEDETAQIGIIVTECKLLHKKQVSNEEKAFDYTSENQSVESNSLKIYVNKETDNKSFELERKETSICETQNKMPQDKSNQSAEEEYEIKFKDKIRETSTETPSPLYEQLVSAINNVTGVSSQFAKSETWQESTQSVSCGLMETNENVTSEELPSQSYEDSKKNEISQSYKPLGEMSKNTPMQSFKGIMEIKKDRVDVDETLDEPNFPTQSYEVEKENIIENLETVAELGEESSIPSQSNNIGADGIGTSSVSTNNSVLIEDETASSSYVPETPENQERDQDQESAISTSSYEILPCEELNIASSSDIADTSVQSELSNIHNKGILEIPTSSYNLNNPDSSSTCMEELATTSYDDQIVVEQSVTTSMQTVNLMNNSGGRSSENYVSDSSVERNEPTSYYSQHEEVTESYYEGICNQEPVQTNSQLEGNSDEEATPSYYESNVANVRSGSEASQSYLNEEQVAPSYSNHDISVSYYDSEHEAGHEANQSFYSSQGFDRSSNKIHQNVEATQSFYQENVDQRRLNQQGDLSPSFVDRYSLDTAYIPVSSPLDRHDLVESSVPTKSMDR